MQHFMKAMALALALPLASTGARAADGAAPASPPEQAASAPTDPLLAPLLGRGAFGSMALSPDGKRIAALLSDNRNTAVAIIDADTMEMRNIVEPQYVRPGKYVAHMRLPRYVSWVANDLLVVNFNDGAALVKPDGAGEPGPYAAWMMQARDEHGGLTDWAIFRRDFDDPKHLSRVNIRTNENYSVDLEMPGKLMRWLADGSGAIRVATTMDTAFWTDTTHLVTWLRDPVTDAWQKIDERSIRDDPFVPLQVMIGSSHLVVQARNGGDRLAIWEFDPSTRAFLARMAEDASDDIVSELSGDDQSSVVSVLTGGLRPTFHWFDPRMAQLQASLDASLPDHVNAMLARREAARMLVFSYSDVDPGRWYLFEPAAMKMKEIVGVIPDIRPDRMQHKRPLRYPSLDGMTVPAYLTLPGQPAGPAPLIVLIHGGPQARDYWGWDRDAQAFAAHGYAVFQPQFRGSTGFGKKFEEAGYGQWGQAMQDDITAGVHYLIDQKIADPDRICIVGASYGGYAALWGLAHTPELYKCGVSTAGVSDIGRMLKADSDTNASAPGRELLKSEVADPARMKVPFDDVSPLKHADRIRAPLLLVHGKLDKRVPISEGQAMLVEMQRLHKDVQWLEFSDEAHGVSYEKNLVQWYQTMFALFERTIGKGEPPLPPPVAAVPAAVAASAAPAASAASR